MSVAHLLRTPDAVLRLDLVRPAAPRIEGEHAPPGDLAPPLVASLVANGIRLALARREGLRGPWPADRAPARLEPLAPDLVPVAEDVLARVRHESDRASMDPTLAAEHALRLARLEAVVRTGYVDARLAEPEERRDIVEAAAILARVPWQDLGSGLLPPPWFPELTDAIRDAEPDAVVDGTLLLVSASRAPRVSEDDLRALVVRLVLARAEWGDEAATRVRSLGVLLARHGILWRTPVAPILAHEAFPQVESWLRQRVARAKKDAAPREAKEGGKTKPLPKWVKKRFAPKAPMTHPDGKAERKKERKEDGPRAPSAPRAPAPAKRARPQAQTPPPREQDDASSRRKVPRPDWRRGSQWRRERGL